MLDSLCHEPSIGPGAPRFIVPSATDIVYGSGGMNCEADLVFEIVSRRLPAAGIACLMIGGHAVNHYGYTRATQDIDFMIAAEDEAAVWRILSAAGFTNVATHPTVVFFQQPGGTLRVDFLKVDRATLDKLLAGSVAVDYFQGHPLRVPCLHDLIAMKLFALKSGRPEREEKDFPDIVHLVIENGLDVATELRPLCDQFGTPALYEQLCRRIQELRHD
jgi:hypothetical protein